MMKDDQSMEDFITWWNTTYPGRTMKPAFIKILKHWIKHQDEVKK